MKLPEYQEAVKGTTALCNFIEDHEPAGPDEAKFRKQLLAVVEEARADALKEAALVAIIASRTAELTEYNTVSRDRMFARSREASSIAAAIEALIDQPQEDVCECNADPSHRIGFKFCPYCGKPIKVTHGDKL